MICLVIDSHGTGPFAGHRPFPWLRDAKFPLFCPVKEQLYGTFLSSFQRQQRQLHICGIEAGRDLIDVGVSARRIENALWQREIDPKSIEALFITHEHSDHIAGLRVLGKRYGFRVYASPGTMEGLRRPGHWIRIVCLS